MPSRGQGCFSVLDSFPSLFLLVMLALYAALIPPGQCLNMVFMLCFLVCYYCGTVSDPLIG